LRIVQSQTCAAKLRDSQGHQRRKHTKPLQRRGLARASRLKQRFGLFLELLEIRPLG
jgi:hypothetical protein